MQFDYVINLVIVFHVIRIVFYACYILVESFFPIF